MTKPAKNPAPPTTHTRPCAQLVGYGKFCRRCGFRSGIHETFDRLTVKKGGRP